MKIAIIANPTQQQVLLSRGVSASLELVWLDQWKETLQADVCIDLLFEENENHRALLEKWQQEHKGIVLVSSVTTTASQLPIDFIRFNGWDGFLENEIIELAGGTIPQRAMVEQVLNGLHRKAEWVQDQVGFIAPRVIANIINEAYLALEEKVSDKAQIDIAMQLGTNYPMGPFAWSQKIGLKKVYQLLLAMSKENNRYHPAYLLAKEAND
ncbi:MAG: 3-hydroxyacyl-CoA dehydrogenase family protein [Chitinophagaceae bacterium]